jgi:hypothetical protein
MVAYEAQDAKGQRLIDETALNSLIVLEDNQADEGPYRRSEHAVSTDETTDDVDAQRTDNQQPIGPARIGEQKDMDPRRERMQAVAGDSGSIRTISKQRLRQEP